MKQGTPEWHASRCGKITASRIADVMAKAKTGESASRRNYRAQLVAERLTGTVAETFTNGAMQWGSENEAIARVAYEIAQGADVTQVGLIDHRSIELCGASPDGLVGADGLVEIKCPNSATHIGYLLAGIVPTDYQLQMLWQMECTGRDWCDFVSYDPRMPESMRLFVVRYFRDAARLDDVRAEVREFADSIDAVICGLRERTMR